MIEHSKKATIIIGAIVLVVIILVPVIMSAMQFEVDEKPVHFSTEGIPHCPYCYRIVEENSGYCQNCGRSFRWIDQQLLCWHCGGQKVCETCNGSGYLFGAYHSGETCYDCNGTGVCQFCLDGKRQGYNIYGNSAVPYEEQRK